MTTRAAPLHTMGATTIHCGPSLSMSLLCTSLTLGVVRVSWDVSAIMITKIFCQSQLMVLYQAIPLIPHNRSYFKCFLSTVWETATERDVVYVAYTRCRTGQLGCICHDDNQDLMSLAINGTLPSYAIDSYTVVR